ncbi:hypothetical protein ES319_D10G253600v1 [Gossypium barbadense]|uniref:Uncharacterized protein n=1 Tax=Gossypium barbadense TaxID=3634 RepID=A0A5J5PYR5_GOSBA|nr:hypothetical protein ES319_D10G253600v1 [Gossypium barbadense]
MNREPSPFEYLLNIVRRMKNKPETTAEESKLLIVSLSKNQGHCWKIWQLFSSSQSHLRHCIFTTTRFILRLIKDGIKFHEILHIVILIFDGICNFHSWM